MNSDEAMNGNESGPPPENPLVSEQANVTPNSMGQRLRDVRRERGLSLADVERKSRWLAKRHKCPQFIVRKSRLSLIENGINGPGPAKLLTLAKIYRLRVNEVVRLWSGSEH
jgi:transcriptional regulator with XRE-family HTH domain